MEQTITSSFCISIRVHRGIKTNGLDIHTYVTDKVNKLCEESIKQYKCQIIFSVLDTPSTLNSVRTKNDYYEFNYSLSICGLVSQVMSARGNILRNNPSQCLSTLDVERWLLLNKDEEVKSTIIEKFNEIMQKTKANIVIDYNKNDKVKPPPGLGSDTIKIEIYGQWESVEKARLKCLVYLDEMCGFSKCSVEIDPKLHYILAGRKRITIDQIMNETSTNIYIPSPLINQSIPKALSVAVGAPPLNTKQSDSSFSPSVIYITGNNQSQVNIAKANLLSLALKKVNKNFIN